MSPTSQRVIGGIALLATGVMSLPVAAFFLDGEGAENYIVPAQLTLMAATGAGLAVSLPALAREGASTGRRAMTGVWWGLLAAFVGVLVSWFMVSGLGGA